MNQSIKLMLLGHPHLERDNQSVIFPRRRAIALLAYLVIKKRVHSREELGSVLYPDMDESAGRAELRCILSVIKAALPKGILIIDRETVMLSKALCVDVDTFGEALSADTIEALLVALAHDPRIEDFFPDGVLWTSLGATPNVLIEMSLWAGAPGDQDL